jgi:hypothetical protein
MSKLQVSGSACLAMERPLLASLPPMLALKA